MVKITFVAAILAVVATSAQAQHFSASDVPGVGIKHTGKVVVSNNSHAITAFRFFGNVREALVSLRSAPVLRSTPFGSTVYKSDAAITQPLPQYMSSLINEAATHHGVDPRLIAAVANRESRFNPRAVSPVGACGVMQLMPATARYLGVNDIFDARQNVFAGTRYLRTLLDTFHGDLNLTLAAYNAGPGAVARYNGVPPFPETQAYVRSIRSAYERSLRD